MAFSLWRSFLRKKKSTLNVENLSGVSLAHERVRFSYEEHRPTFTVLLFLTSMNSENSPDRMVHCLRGISLLMFELHKTTQHPMLVSFCRGHRVHWLTADSRIVALLSCRKHFCHLTILLCLTPAENIPRTHVNVNSRNTGAYWRSCQDTGITLACVHSLFCVKRGEKSFFWNIISVQ